MTTSINFIIAQNFGNQTKTAPQFTAEEKAVHNACWTVDEVQNWRAPSGASHAEHYTNADKTAYAKAVQAVLATPQHNV